MSIMKTMFNNCKFAVLVIGKVKNPGTDTSISSALAQSSASVEVCALVSDKTNEMAAIEDCCNQFDKMFPDNLGRYVDIIVPIAEHKHRMSMIKSIHDYFNS